MFCLTTRLISYMASDIMVKAHFTGYSYLTSSKGSVTCSTRIVYTTAFVTPAVEHWLEREIAQRDYGVSA